MIFRFADTWLGGKGSRPLVRPVVPVVVALISGITAADLGLQLPGWGLGGSLLVLLILMASAWWRSQPVRLTPLVFFCLLGMGLYQQAIFPALPPHHLVHLPQDQALSVQGRLARPSKAAGERLQLFMAVEAVITPEGWRKVTGQLLVLAPIMEAPPVGTKLVVRGRLRPPRVLKNPGAFNRVRYLAADGIFRELTLRDQRDLVFLNTEESYPLGEKLRGGIRRQLKALHSSVRAMYLAMLLGDQGEVTPAMRQAFARTGTSHLLVINGLHLSMVAGVIYFLSFWLLRRFPWLLLRVNVMKISTLLAALAVAGYAWVAGGSPSTQRAEIMVLAYLLLVFLGRPREVWSALALAALLILVLSPLRLFFISFQLSFAAVAALLYIMPRFVQKSTLNVQQTTYKLHNWLYYFSIRVGLLAKEWLLVSLVATLATAPLVAHYFQVVSILGILVNIAAIPLVLGLSLPLGEAAVLAQGFGLPPVAEVLLFLGKWPMLLGYKIIDYASRLPGAAVFLPTPSWWQICAYYGCLAGIFATRRNYLTWAGTTLSGLVLVGSLAFPTLQPPRELELTLLDTYGNLAAVAAAPGGHRLVISAPAPSWPGRQVTSPGPLPAYLHRRQWRRLDQVVALGLSKDNASELLTLAQQFQVGGFWFGRLSSQGPPFWELWNYLGDRGQMPRSLSRASPPASLAGVKLAYHRLGKEQGFGLILTWQGGSAVIMPPLRQSEAAVSTEPASRPVEVLIMPLALAGTKALADWVRHYQPQHLVLYGADRRHKDLKGLSLNLPTYLTKEGAVSIYGSTDKVRLVQYQP